MGSFLDAILLTLQCRDIWDEEKPEGMVRNKLFHDFSGWITAHLSGQNTGHAEVINLLKISTAPFSPSLYSRESLREKIYASILPKAYRVAHAIDQRNGESDRRVRDLFEFIVREKCEMIYYGLLCPAFTYIGENERTRGKGSTSFMTGKVTRFQQLLFLCAIVEISSMLATEGTGGRKKTKTSKKLVSVPKRFKIGGKLRNTAQRVGFAIHAVVKDWDALATRMGFHSIEEVVLPYSRLCDADIRFLVLSTRVEGFPPKSERLRFTPGRNLTSHAGETYPGVMERPAYIDECLRQLSKLFFADVSNSIRSQSLYFASSPEQWLPKKPDSSPLLGLPARFRNMDLETFQFVRERLNASQEAFQETSTASLQKSNPECTPKVCISTNEYVAPVEIVGFSGGGEKPSHKPASDHIYHIPEDQDWKDDILAGTWIDIIGKRMRDELSRQFVSQEDLDSSLEVLRKEIEPFARMWCCKFDDLEETDELKSVQADFRGSVQLSFYDTRTSVQSKQHLLTLDDINESMKLDEAEAEKVVDLLRSELKLGGHGIIFCTVLQYTAWVDRILEACDEVSNDGEQENDNFTLCIDSEPLIFVSNASSFTSPMAVTESEYEGGAFQLALHVTKIRVNSTAHFRLKQNISEDGYVATSFPSFVNIIDNIPDLISPCISKTDDNGSCQERELEEPKLSLELLKELIIRYSQPGDIILDRLGRFYDVGVACITMPRPRRFIGCEITSHIHKKGLKNVLYTFADEVIATPRKFKISIAGQDAAKAIGSIKIRKLMASSNNIPSALPPYQSFPRHVYISLANEWNEPGFLSKCENRPVQQWPRKFRKNFNACQAQLLLKYEAISYGVVVGQSTIDHPKAGKGLFAAKTFHPQDIICTYYGTILYKDLTKAKGETSTHGHGLLSLDRTRFRQYALQLDVTGSAFREVRELVDGRLAVFIVPAPFCVGSIINDPCYVEGDEGKLKEKTENSERRTANAAFIPRIAPVRRPRDLLRHDLIEIVATRLINPNEEIFVPYSKSDLL